MAFNFSFGSAIRRVSIGGAALAAIVLLTACAGQLQPAGPAIQEAALTGDHFVMADGYRLQVRQTEATIPLRANVIALHGINDYGRSWHESAARWANEGITTYAYDQRGFGANELPGIWPTAETLTTDLRQTIELVQGQHPEVPLYLVGESMGSAVIMALLGQPDAPEVEGAVLGAPAVWARETMSPTYARVLSTMNSLMPGLVLRGNGLGRQASSNIAELIRLGRDPLVIKGARVDVINGLVNLMDKAYAAAPEIRTPTLVLYGERDEIVPKRSVAETVERFNNTPVIAVYPKGWHMLYRDLNGPVVQNDVRHWILKGGRDLPSGADDRADFLTAVEDRSGSR